MLKKKSSKANKTKFWWMLLVLISFTYFSWLISISPQFPEQGNYSFNSTGGLLNYNPNPAGNLFDGINLQAKHIRVVSLVPGEAAVAMYYNEGSIQPKGYGAVAHYLTRVSETFVKENGKWVMVTGHYSPITGGQGTSQVGKGFSKDE